MKASDFKRGSKSSEVHPHLRGEYVVEHEIDEFDADLLYCGKSAEENKRDFAAQRRMEILKTVGKITLGAFIGVAAHCLVSACQSQEPGEWDKT